MPSSQAFGNSEAESLLWGRNTPVLVAECVPHIGHAGLKIFSAWDWGGKENGVRDLGGVRVDLNGHIKGLPPARWNLDNLKQLRLKSWHALLSCHSLNRGGLLPLGVTLLIMN